MKQELARYQFKNTYTDAKNFNKYLPILILRPISTFYVVGLIV